jgi:radical SAM superfamily enzyme YgiQ (UPF0313 family)
MDILLIDPPYKALKGIGSEHGYSLNMVSLAAYLREGGFDAAVLTGDLLLGLPVQEALTFDVKRYAEGQKDYERILADETHALWQKICHHIQYYNPKAVGITCLTPAKDLVDKIASLVKRVNLDIKVIVGGHHPTFCAHETLRNPNIDFAIRGEGEVPLLQLTRKFESGKPSLSALPSITYKANGKIVSNPDGYMVKNLDSLPFPARDLVIDCDYNQYKSHYVATSRGCPYSCSFCSDRRMWRKKVRRRSIEDVIEEIKHLNGAYDVGFIDFVDATFTYDTAFLGKFCQTLIEEKINIRWRCTARYDSVNEEVLDLMKKSNCVALYLGLESGSERILKSINKKTTIETIIRASELVYRSGIGSITSVLLGLPQEEKQDIESTLRLMKKIKTDIFDINCYVPLPGSELYDGISEQDRMNINWRKVGYKSFNNYFAKKTSQNDLKGFVLKAYDIAENTRKKFQERGGWNSKVRKA